MGIKTITVFVLIMLVAIRAPKDPIKPLCLLIALMGLMENRDFIPRTMLSIPGLNAWNILFLFTSLSWMKQRESVENIPPSVKSLFFFYCSIVFISHVRLLINPTDYLEESFVDILINYFFNPLKFTLPAIIVFELANNDRISRLMAFSIVAGYLVLAAQVIRYMGISEFSGEALNQRGVRVIARDTGYHRVDASAMLAGGSWAAFSLIALCKQHFHRIAVLGASIACLVAVALTGGRAGYLAWGVTGFFMCLIKWRKLLPIFPLGVIAVFALMPGVRDRLTQGFGSSDSTIVEDTNEVEVTSGRTQIWPLVIETIKSKPIVGVGREGMQRSGLTERTIYELQERWGHPHNAYLELLLDNGIVGLILMVPIYLVAYWRGLSLFIKGGTDLEVAIGGSCIALLTAFFVASIGSQTFYPRQGMLAIFCAMALTIRYYHARPNAESLKSSSWKDFVNIS